LFLTLIASTACSSDGGATDPGAADADLTGLPDAAGGETPDAALPGDWTSLISGDWEIPAGDEGYRCVRKTLSEDTYITGFKSIGPLGTHHTVLTAGAPTGPDGISNCNALENNSSMIFGSGVGDIEYHFPAGVGVKIPAGQQLLLNLHLFNIADAPLTGTSGSEAIMVAASAIENEAESLLMGRTFGLTIPTGESTQNGSCTFDQDHTLLTVGPHMHQLGTHMRVDAIRAAGDIMVHDAAYDFQDQKLYVLEPISVKTGDKITVACSYTNDTGGTVSFGDSSEEEMCFAIMYLYPKRPTSQFGAYCDDVIGL
jgi:hypothetical protein